MNIPLGKWSGSDATDALHATIKDFIKQSGEQTRTMIRLTLAIVFLTAAMFLAVAVQIYLLVKA